MRSSWTFGLALALAACSGDGPEGGSKDLVLMDENNFSYSGTLAIEEVQVQSATDFCADWSAMTTDIRDRALDPATVEQVALLEFDLTKAEVEAKVSDNTLKQSDAATQWLYTPVGGETSVCASQFEIIGNVLDPADIEENADQTWLMSLLKLPDGVNDVLTSVFVTPTDASTNHDVTFTDTSSILSVTVDIAGKPAIKTTAGLEDYTLDWSAVTNDVNGQPYDPLYGDKLLIARYDAADATEVEAVFLRLDEEAEETYKLDVFGETDALLSDAETSDGTAFAGFTTDGVWLVAISCSICTSPVPLLLSVVEVAEGE